MRPNTHIAGDIFVSGSGVCGQGWQVSSVYGKNRVSSVTEEILSSLPFWEEMEETKLEHSVAQRPHMYPPVAQNSP
jgi:hypothetical protein